MTKEEFHRKIIGKKEFNFGYIGRIRLKSGKAVVFTNDINDKSMTRVIVEGGIGKTRLAYIFNRVDYVSPDQDPPAGFTIISVDEKDSRFVKWEILQPRIKKIENDNDSMISIEQLIKSNLCEKTEDE